MKKNHLLILLFCAAFLFLYSLKTKKSPQVQAPKLVIGLVVDQMRYDYIARFWDAFGDDGIKKLVKHGRRFNNTHFNYVPTYTGPGHASIFSGTTPRYHGIIANDWYERQSKSLRYCTTDTSVFAVGDGSVREGQMSPKSLRVNAIADEMKLFSI